MLVLLEVTERGRRIDKFPNSRVVVYHEAHDTRPFASPVVLRLLGRLTTGPVLWGRWGRAANTYDTAAAGVPADVTEFGYD